MFGLADAVDAAGRTNEARALDLPDSDAKGAEQGDENKKSGGTLEPAEPGGTGGEQAVTGGSEAVWAGAAAVCGGVIGARAMCR